MTEGKYPLFSPLFAGVLASGGIIDDADCNPGEGSGEKGSWCIPIKGGVTKGKDVQPMKGALRGRGESDSIF